MSHPGASLRPRLADPSRCPSCGAPLIEPRCHACGATLTGSLAAQVWHASTQADLWLDTRDRLVADLRAAARSSAVVPAAPARPQAATPSQTDVHPPRPAYPPPAVAPSPRPSRPRRAIGVQEVLVGLGALLLAVAAVVFLAFSWDRLGIGGRSAVVAGSTVAVLVGAVLARRAQMGATAEAVAALGSVLVVLDAAAVRASGLFGEQVGWLAYTSATTAVCAGVLASVGSLGRLRAPTFTAALLAPVSPVAAGLALADDASGGTAVVLAASGLLGGAAVALVRPLLERHGLTAEAVMLQWFSSLLVLVASLCAVAAAAIGMPGAGAMVALLVAALAVVMSVVVAERAAWAVVGGGAVATAVSWWAVDVAGWNALALAPGLAGAVVLAALAGAAACRPPAGLLLRAGAKGALAVTGLAAAPGAAVAALQLVPVLAALGRPWQSSPSQPWADAAALSVLDEYRAAGVAAVGVVALVLVGVTRLSGPTWAGRGAALSAGTLLVCLPWAPGTALWVVVLVAAAAGGAAIGTGHLLRHRTTARWLGDRAAGTVLVVTGSTGLTLSVTSAWLAPTLAAPATAVGAGALLAARRALSVGWGGAGTSAVGGAARTLLSVAATLAGLALVAAVCGAARLDGEAAFVVACLAGAVPPLLVSVTAGPAGAERRAVALTGATALVVGLYATAWHVREPLPWQLVLAALAVVSAVVAVDLRRRWTVADRHVAAPATVALATVTAGALTDLAGGRDVLPVLACALTVAAACLVVATLRRREHALALGTEMATAAVAAALLLVTTARAWGGDHAYAAWPVLLVLAVGALLLTTSPSRRWAGWVALSLATTAWWERLAAGDVGLVEVWTLPPALVLAAAAAHAIRRGPDLRHPGRRDPGRRAPDPLRPSAIGAAALFTLPSTAAAVTGSPWRPAALLLAAGLTVAVAWWVSRRADETGWTDRRLLVLLLGAAAAAVSGVWSRAVLATDWRVEVWALGAAAVLAAVAWVAATRRHGPHGAVWRGWAPVPAVLAAGLPSVLAPGAYAPDQAVPLARHLAVVVAAGLLLVVCARRDQAPFGRPTRGAALALLAVAGTAGVLRPLPGTVEVMTVSVGLVLVVVGWVGLRRRAESGSWPWLGTGLVVALVPTLVLAIVDDSAPRGVLLVATAGLVLAWGAVRAWQSPVLVSAGVLVVYALSQLVVVYAAVPRWASLAVVGVALLALGARYERRLRDLGVLGRRLAAMR